MRKTRRFRPPGFYVSGNDVVPSFMWSTEKKSDREWSDYGLQFLHGVYPAEIAAALLRRATLLLSFILATDGHDDT